MPFNIDKKQLIPIRAQLRAVAFSNPCYTGEQLLERSSSPEFHALLELTGQTAIDVLLLVGVCPTTNRLNWSVTACVRAGNKLKKQIFWTNAERQLLKNLLRFWLEDVGEKYHESSFCSM